MKDALGHGSNPRGEQNAGVEAGIQRAYTGGTCYSLNNTIQAIEI
jgi:hypothetical protein